MPDPQSNQATGPRRSHTFSLSVMMFFQFFLWGAWFVTLGPYMGAKGFKGTDIGNAYSVAPIAAILSPLFLGIVADRLFASQRVMGVLHVLGGLLLAAAPSIAQSADQSPWPFIGILLAHMLCYMPTLGLSNTVAFNAMNNPEKQFPIVRVWGTIGWIVAGLIVGFMAKKLIGEQATPAETETARAASPHFFYVAGASGVVLGLFSFFLPNTPAPSKGKPVNIGSMLGLDALQLLRNPSFLVFCICSLLICIPLAAYYSFAGVYAGATGIENVPFKMTFGQMSEIGFMLVMPLFFRRLGVKWMLAVGMLAWVLRYGLFAGAWNSSGTGHVMWMVLGGIILHGICYDFFFVTGQIYTEQTAPKEVRAQAQGFLVLITQGVGMLIGNQVFGRLVDHYTNQETKATDWRTVWMIPAAFAGLILLVFIASFKNRPSTTT
ncbi:MAG TPA: nucleoside permease [Phycisphaerales bacterium]|nr:nucleoside permease [Phycisphaerales bacterium]